MNNYKKILLVEDEEAVRKEISEALTTENFQVKSVSNGIDALIQIKMNKPDIIVSNIMMPLLNGDQFIKRIKKYPETEHIPIVFISKQKTKADFNLSIYGNEVSYLNKPLSIEKLLQTLKNKLKTNQKSKTEKSSKSSLPYATSSKKHNKSVFKNIETHLFIKNIVVKEAVELNRQEDIMFLLHSGTINHKQNYFEKIVKHMIRHAINISSKGNKIFVLSKFENNNFSFTVKSKKANKKLIDNDIYNNNSYIPLGHTIDLSIIKSISRLLDAELSLDHNKNNSFSISILINLSK